MQTRDPVHGAILLSAALFLSGAFATPQDDPRPNAATAFSPVNLVRHKGARSALRLASEGAARRLERPECAAVFSDFSDAKGRPLEERLRTLGLTGRHYFQGLVFTDGAGLARCHDQGLIAITVPGSRVVFLCGRQFARAAFENPVYAEATLIHETLHSLGLGENPPTARQISDRVLARCGP